MSNVMILYGQLGIAGLRGAPIYEIVVAETVAATAQAANSPRPIVHTHGNPVKIVITQNSDNVISNVRRVYLHDASSAR